MHTTTLGRACQFTICSRHERLSAHAGVVLLRDFLDKLGVAELLDEHLHLKQRERGYPESQNVLSLCWNSLLGGRCLLDLNALRSDPGLATLLGVESLLAPTTAGEFLRAFTLGDLWDLQRVLRLLAARLRPQQKSTRVTLDLDASLYEQCSTRKQGSARHYQGQVGYYPLLVFWAEEHELLFTHLRRGNAHASPIALWVVRQALKFSPAGLPVYLRADSEFYTWELLAFLAEQGITYAITADQSPGLQAAVAALPEKAWRAFAPGAQVADLWYAPSGHATHRYVVKRQRVTDKKTKRTSWRYHVVITNDRRRGPKKLMRWALGRCTVENKIKEHKTDFGLEKMPTNKFLANWAWLLIGQLAWNLLAWFKRLCLPKECHPLMVGTLRQRLLNVVGKITTRGRQWFLYLSDQNWFHDWWTFALQQLARFQPISP